MRNDSDRLQWQTEKNYIMNAALEQMLDSVVHELNHRRTEFSIAGCANLEEYVQTTGEELHRIVVILDETSMILDTTGRCLLYTSDAADD